MNMKDQDSIKIRYIELNLPGGLKHSAGRCIEAQVPQLPLLYDEALLPPDVARGRHLHLPPDPSVAQLGRPLVTLLNLVPTWRLGTFSVLPI